LLATAQARHRNVDGYSVCLKGVYTRVATEYGLVQFAWMPSSEADVRSQAHEGWRLLPTQYNDGGFSGGSLNPPALQKLLSDIRDRLVDVMVVYKVDRLTRSSADFAKLVELFDARGVSFVSVTQAFNTPNSMGRLTLNVLLSFAQFEREALLPWSATDCGFRPGP
jgi:site-specific DNA recombinase